MRTSRQFALRLLLPPLLLLAATLVVLAGRYDLPCWLDLRAALLPAGPVAWSALTLLGDALVTPLLIVPFLARRPRLGLEGALAAVLATIGVHVLKPLVQMPRPAGMFEGITVIGPRLLAGSFPSGHTASAFTVLGLLVMAGALRGIWPQLLGLVLALLVGLSRVVVGAHWPSDVLAGAALGWCCGGFAVVLARRLALAEQPAWQGAVGALLAAIALLDLFGHDTGYPQGIWLQQAVAAAMLLVLLRRQLQRRSS